MSDERVLAAVSRVPQPTTAGKLTDRRSSRRSLRSLTLTCFVSLIAVVAAFTSVGVAPASASAAASLTLHTRALPTQFSSADNEDCIKQGGLDKGETPPCDGYQVTVTNSGGLVDAGPVTVTDTLPAGLKVISAYLFWAKNRASQGSVGEELYPEFEGGKPNTLCTTETGPERVSCEFTSAAGEMEPEQRLEMDVFVTVEEGAGSAMNTASVSEAGTRAATVSEDDVISTSVPSFGPSAFLSEIAGTNGQSDLQAGDHPYNLETRIDLNTQMGVTTGNEFAPATVGSIRDVVVDLPLGVLGSAVATPRCTFAQLQSYPNSCPLETLVGHIAVEPKGEASVNADVYNMVPEHGIAAEFGYSDSLHNTHAIVAGVAPTPAGYVLRAIAHEVPQVTLTDLLASIYGDPSAKQEEVARLEGKEPRYVTLEAMFTNPSDCSGEPLKTQLYVDSWQAPGTFNADGTPDLVGPGSHGWVSLTSESPPVSGCDALRFDPEAFSVQPDTTAADSPAGLSVDLKSRQSEQPETLATPPLRDATVTLPAGLTINLSAVSGLQACSEAQIGWLGGSVTNFTPNAPTCPEASKVGTVEVDTPLLQGPLEGAVYLASQNENPFDSMLAGYIVIDDTARGIVVKLAGKIALDEATGQVTGTFDENPQLPFSDLKLRFSGGPRGKLVTPESCGTFTTTSVLTPWSAPESGPSATPSSSFAIASGVGGAACPSGGVLFTPAFTAGTTSNQAGAYSPFTLMFSRQDSEGDVSAFTFTTPPGLLANLSSVPPCEEPQAARGECSQASELGTATVHGPAQAAIRSTSAAASISPDPTTASRSGSRSSSRPLLAHSTWATYLSVRRSL